MDLSHLMSAAQAAERLGVTPDWIRKLCSREKLDCGKVGGVILVTVESVDEYAAQNVKRGRKPKPRRKIKGT